MNEQNLPNGLRLAFRFAGITGLAYGSMFFFISLFSDQVLGWSMVDPGYRILGGSILAIAIASFLAAKSKQWSEVRFLVLIQVIWPVLGAFGSIWGFAERSLPGVVLVNAVLGFGFAAVFGWYYVSLSED